MKNDWWFLSTIALFTRVGVQQIGSKKHGIHRMPDEPYSPNLATSDLYLFSTIKENSNGFTWLMMTSFLSACKEF
jgi:hypothetical protein